MVLATRQPDRFRVGGVGFDRQPPSRPAASIERTTSSALPVMRC